MTARWGSCAVLAICLALLIGCRTPQPVVKPPTPPERYVAPPNEARYETTGYPKAAFDPPVDPVKRALDTKINPASMGRGGGGGGMMPGAGSMGPSRY